jgi:hypothetical protein
MKFYRYSIFYDGKKVGEMISTNDDPRKATDEWLDKISTMVSAGILKTLKDEPGLLVVEKNEVL